MNNHEWLKSMDLKQMAKTLTKLGNCNFCAYSSKDSKCKEADGCYSGILEWLKKEN